MIEMRPEEATPGSPDATKPFLVRFATRRSAAPTPRGETSLTKAYPPETSDE